MDNFVFIVRRERRKRTNTRQREKESKIELGKELRKVSRNNNTIQQNLIVCLSIRKEKGERKEGKIEKETEVTNG